jgi:hypothetical protein
MHYFWMFGPNDHSLAVVRCASPTYPLDQLESSLRDGSLVHMVASDGPLVDYPPNDLVGATGLYSARMQRVLQEFAGHFTWVSVCVSRMQVAHNYFALVVRETPDVLDETLTVRNRATGDVIKPVLSREKLRDVHLFAPTPFSPAPVCSAHVRELLEKVPSEGVEFVKIPISG